MAVNEKNNKVNLSAFRSNFWNLIGKVNNVHILDYIDKAQQFTKLSLREIKKLNYHHKNLCEEELNNFLDKYDNNDNINSNTKIPRNSLNWFPSQTTTKSMFLSNLNLEKKKSKAQEKKTQTKISLTNSCDVDNQSNLNLEKKKLIQEKKTQTKGSYTNSYNGDNDKVETKKINKSSKIMDIEKERISNLGRYRKITPRNKYKLPIKIMKDYDIHSKIKKKSLTIKHLLSEINLNSSRDIRENSQTSSKLDKFQSLKDIMSLSKKNKTNFLPIKEKESTDIDNFFITNLENTNDSQDVDTFKDSKDMNKIKTALFSNKCFNNFSLMNNSNEISPRENLMKFEREYDVKLDNSKKNEKGSNKIPIDSSDYKDSLEDNSTKTKKDNSIKENSLRIKIESSIDEKLFQNGKLKISNNGGKKSQRLFMNNNTSNSFLQTLHTMTNSSSQQNVMSQLSTEINKQNEFNSQCQNKIKMFNKSLYPIKSKFINIKRVNDPQIAILREKSEYKERDYLFVKDLSNSKCLHINRNNKLKDLEIIYASNPKFLYSCRKNINDKFLTDFQRQVIKEEKQKMESSKVDNRFKTNHKLIMKLIEENSRAIRKALEQRELYKEMEKKD